MAQEQWPLYCERCRGVTPHIRNNPDAHHVVHALLTIFTCFAWSIVWLIFALATKPTPWVCSRCGLLFDEDKAIMRNQPVEAVLEDGGH